MAATKVKSLAEQKQDLIARSDLYRQAMVGEIQHIQATFGWLPKTLYLIKTASPLLIMASPLAAWLMRGRKKNKAVTKDPAKDKVGVFARAWGIFRIAQQIVPFVHGFMKAWPATNNSHARKPAPAPAYQARD